MRALPSQLLDGRMRIVWMASGALKALVAAAVIMGAYAAVSFNGIVPPSWVLPTLIALAVAAVIVYAVAYPMLKYRFWRYEVAENDLDIVQGVVWRTRTVIPFVRVQNTDTVQGPILRILGLASVTVATAAGSHVIPGLAFDAADALRDRIAEQARLAQEDV